LMLDREHCRRDSNSMLVAQGGYGAPKPQIRKTDRLGDKAWMEVMREHNAIVRAQLKAHDGFEVKSEGDGFMVAFQSARKAIECAAAIQNALAERNATVAEPVNVRMGSHVGDVIKEGEDFFGRNVILAARVS
jgi:class 3 adenylate cyclase